MRTRLNPITEPSTENFLWFQRFKAGDEKALAYIHKHTHKALAWYGRQYLSDPFEIESIVQEVFIKAWSLRDRMETMEHIYYFMRMNIEWYCLAWLRSPRNVFYRKQIYHTDNTEAYETGRFISLSDIHEQCRFFDEERIAMIEKAIPYLPPTRKNMLELHFRQGIPYKTIARRYGSNPIAVHVEVQKGLDHLKQMIHRKKKKVTPAVTPVSAAEPELTRILRYRREYKMDFAAIAGKMNLTQEYVQQKYVEAYTSLNK